MDESIASSRGIVSRKQITHTLSITGRWPPPSMVTIHMHSIIIIICPIASLAQHIEIANELINLIMARPNRKKLSSSSSLNHFIVEIYHFRRISAELQFDFWRNNWMLCPLPLIWLLLSKYNSSEISAPLMWWVTQRTQHTLARIWFVTVHWPLAIVMTVGRPRIAAQPLNGVAWFREYNRNRVRVFIFCHSEFRRNLLHFPLVDEHGTRTICNAKQQQQKPTANEIENEHRRNAQRIITIFLHLSGPDSGPAHTRVLHTKWKTYHLHWRVPIRLNLTEIRN